MFDISDKKPHVLCGRKMTAKIQEFPAKKETARSQPDAFLTSDLSILIQLDLYVFIPNPDYGEYERKIQTVRPILSRLYPYNPCTHEYVDGCYPGHKDHIIQMMKSLDLYCQKNQDWQEWDYQYIKNTVGDCENTYNEEYYLYDFQVIDNGIGYCYEGVIPHAADDG